MDKVTLPEFPITGSCQCGAVRYELISPPAVFYICHCTECQKQSASAFGESLRVNIADLKVHGTIATYERNTTFGNITVCDFCPKCSSRLTHRRGSNKTAFNIKAGTLDDTSWLKPACHIWTQSKQPWVSIPDDTLNHPTQPDNFDEIIARWDEMIGN